MKQKGRWVFITSFLLPAVSLYSVFVVWPVIQALQFSTYRWRGISQNKKFVGLDNFNQLYGDKVFWEAFRHNLFLFVGAGIAVLLIALTTAHALQGEGKGVRTLRGIYLFPHIVSLVVVAILWQFIYNPQYGLLTSGLTALGLGAHTKTWLGDRSTALAAVGVAFVWYAMGFYVMLFSAGMKTIPEEVNEAAKLDGAEGLKKFRKVTFPLLWSITRIATIYLVIGTMNIFALVFLMTQGGPDRATEVSLTYLYEAAFANSEFGFATSIAVTNLVVVMLMTALLMFLFRRDPQDRRSA